MGCAH